MLIIIVRCNMFCSVEHITCNVCKLLLSISMFTSKLPLGRFAILIARRKQLIHLLGNSGEDEGTKTMPYAYFNLFDPLTRLAFISCFYVHILISHSSTSMQGSIRLQIARSQLLNVNYLYMYSVILLKMKEKAMWFCIQSMFDPSTRILILCFYVHNLNSQDMCIH